MIVDLSIDFDFFVREDPWWDWGHDERMHVFMEQAWKMRYRNGLVGLGPDVVKETDPATHADFLPLKLPEQLMAKNMVLSSRRAVRVADSHVHAYEMLTASAQRGGKPDVLLNIDAHHDVFSTGPLNCGNWLVHYAQRVPGVRMVQLYPEWKWRDNYDGPGKLPALELRSFKSFSFPTPVVVRDIFLCRSGSWVPPHLDDQFKWMALRFAKGAMSYGFAGDLPEREQPDYATLEAEGKQLAAQLKALEALPPGSFVGPASHPEG